MICIRQKNTVLIALICVVSLYMVLNSSFFEAKVAKRDVLQKLECPPVPVPASVRTGEETHDGEAKAKEETQERPAEDLEEYLAPEQSSGAESEAEQQPRQSLAKAAAEDALRKGQDQRQAAGEEQEDTQGASKEAQQAPKSPQDRRQGAIEEKDYSGDASTEAQKAPQSPQGDLPPLPCNMDWHFHSHQRLHTQKDSPGKLNHKPLLVLFTSFKNSRNRNMSHTNTIMNWGRFRPEVAPVAFNDSTDPYLLNLAKKHGWTILPLHDKASHEAPRVEYMYEAARKTFPDSLFVGFANGDILFDDGLLDTVRFVGSLVPSLNRTMIIGARYNVELKEDSVTTSEEIRRLIREERTPEIVPICIDYFIIARNQFPWHQFPDNLVIGRPAYDNYLVGLARHDNMTVVDSSCTIGALHQIGKDGTKSGSHNIDSEFNINLLKGFNKGTGKINKAAYFTLPGEENTGLALHKHDKEKHPTKKDDFNNLTQ